MIRTARCLCLTACLLLALCSTAGAAGKMYASRGSAPPAIRYQRAFVLFADGMETLVVQSQYALPGGAANNTATSATANLGWVVPVPGVPEIASMSADDASFLFDKLGHQTRRNEVSVRLTAIVFCLPVLAGVFVVSPLLWLLSDASWFPVRMRRYRGLFARGILYSTCLLVGAAIAVPNLLHSSDYGVDVIREERVGIYDVRVVYSQDPPDLIEWLQRNSFGFDEADAAAFDRYTQDGWNFVVARVSPSLVGVGGLTWMSDDVPRGKFVSNGLAAPLVLRFPTESPVYPLALGATAGNDTEVLLYVAAKNKMTCDNRLPLCFAGRADPGRWERELPRSAVRELSAAPITSDGLGKSPSLILTKYRGTLTPEQMREDLEFAPAPDAGTYRERLVQW